MRTGSRKLVSSGPAYLPLALEVQARDAFFIQYVNGFSQTWHFLKDFYNPTHSPDNLKLSIDAVSLAYFSHQVYSVAALATARHKYISALHMTNKALQDPETAKKDSTLLASLLLDLFEKFTNNEPRQNESWSWHVKGALALISLRGFEQFRGPSALRVLMRLSTNFLISCVATASPVPRELIAIRLHVQKCLKLADPKWRLSDLMVHYANLKSNIRSAQFSVDACLSMAVELDEELETLAITMPFFWQYTTTNVDQRSKRIYNGRFDTYPLDRHITQTWNVLRLVRILLNETIMEYCLGITGYLSSQTCAPLVIVANSNIETLASEICASVPQYIDCLGPAQSRQAAPEKSAVNNILSAVHQHSPSHLLDCYTLIFPLFVAGQSKRSPASLKVWVIKQLHFMGSHFGIRNAELVGQVLEQGRVVDPWAVYAMLGSYAFGA